MEETQIKEEQQEEEKEVSIEVIKNDYNPHKKSSCASFLRSYKPYFIKNFNEVCKERCTCDLCLKELNIEGDYLYDVMFNPDIEISENEVRNLFNKLILHSAPVDIVLNQAWLQMTDDYVSGLRRLKGRVDEISSLTKLLNKLYRLLDESYYLISKQVNIEKPQVDITSETYMRLMRYFKKYIESAEDDNRETTGLKIHSFYHSTPLNMTASVAKVDQDAITLNVHPYVAVSLQRVAVAFISSPVHDEVYKAYADHIDLKKSTVRFTSLISHDNNSENRTHVRVDLSQITTAMIIGKDAEAEGIIYDMSEVSCAIYIRSVNIHNFEPGSPVRFITRLPETSGGASIKIDTMATIYQSYKQGENDLKAYRVVIRYDNKPAFFAGLASYVSSRQREIIRELKDISDVTLDVNV